MLDEIAHRMPVVARERQNPLDFFAVRKLNFCPGRKNDQL